MSKKKEKDINITSHNQSGGITAYQVNIGAQRRNLDQNLFDDLVSQLPEWAREKRQVCFRVRGEDIEAVNFCQNLMQFFQKDGWIVGQMVPVLQDMSIKPGIEYRQIGDYIQIIVGSNL